MADRLRAHFGHGRAALVLLSLTLGCSRAATFSMRDGSVHSGVILRNDGQNVYIENSSGRVETLDAREVTDVSHPGKAQLITGAALIGVGTMLFFAEWNDECSEENRERDDCFTDKTRHLISVYLFSLFAVPGAAVGFYGLTTYAGSYNRLWDVPRAAAPRRLRSETSERDVGLAEPARCRVP